MLFASWLLSVMRLLSIITKPLKLAIMPDNHHVHWLLVVGIYVNTKWLLIGHYRIWTVLATIEPLALFFFTKNLCIERKIMKEICAVKCFAVSLRQSYLIFTSFKYFCFIKSIQSNPWEVWLSCDESLTINIINRYSFI